MKTWCYYLGVSALITHELDAVLNHEWKLLFHWFDLSDGVGNELFIALHFPLFLLFLYFSHHKQASVQSSFRSLICAFLIFHGGLHFFLSDHSNYLFSGFLSNFYIFGGLVFGLIYLALSWLPPTDRQES